MYEPTTDDDIDMCFTIFDEPAAYVDALRKPDAAKRVAAMDEEITILTNNGT